MESFNIQWFNLYYVIYNIFHTWGFQLFVICDIWLLPSSIAFSYIFQSALHLHSSYFSSAWLKMNGTNGFFTLLKWYMKLWPKKWWNWLMKLMRDLMLALKWYHDYFRTTLHGLVTAQQSLPDKLRVRKKHLPRWWHRVWLRRWPVIRQFTSTSHHVAAFLHPSLWYRYGTQ